MYRKTADWPQEMGAKMHAALHQTTDLSCNGGHRKRIEHRYRASSVSCHAAKAATLRHGPPLETAAATLGQAL